MKKLYVLALATIMSVLPAAAQGRGHGKGRPATTGLEHAEMTANAHGQRGIENAENKQAEHKDKDKDKDKDGKAKGHHKKHHKKNH